MKQNKSKNYNMKDVCFCFFFPHTYTGHLLIQLFTNTVCKVNHVRGFSSNKLVFPVQFTTVSLNFSSITLGHSIKSTARKDSLPGKGVLPESWVQIHGRKCTYATPQPLVSAYFPCYKQRAEKQIQEATLRKLNFHNMDTT